MSDDFFYLQEINIAVRYVCVFVHYTFRRVGLCIVVITHRVYSMAKTELHAHKVSGQYIAYMVFRTNAVMERGG